MSETEADHVKALQKLADACGYILRKNRGKDAALQGREYQLLEKGSNELVEERRLEWMERFLHDCKSRGQNEPFPRRAG